MPSAGGRLLSIWNYPLRSKLWKLVHCAMHPRTGQSKQSSFFYPAEFSLFNNNFNSFLKGSFALADERGQIFKCSMMSYNYDTVRNASTPVSSMAFIPSQKTHLLVGKFITR